ncbi:TIGR03364 family FAD-dependent oxidoreductase [Parapedobacter pyrenivorans]|uniref:TIGR03364 family FAD-dependent oxidoreductase n=1 Tax=Parapedobacter pyrenivorans TaxID=1305674 RepID=UPI00333ED754
MEKKFDLIVVGGGILGTFHAYHALTRGLSVLLLEKDNFPVGATVRNFGQVIPSGMTGEWFTYGLKGLEVYAAIQRQFDISVRNNGSIYIASDSDEQLLLHELHAHFQQVGYPSQLLSKATVLERYPAVRPSYVREALFFPKEVSVEPHLMIHRLHQYLQQRFDKFQLIPNAPVVDCFDTSAGVKIQVSGMGSVVGDKVIICNGNEFKLLFPELLAKSGQVISKLQMIQTQPFPEAVLPGNILTGLTIRRYESFAEYCPSFSTISTPSHYQELQEWGIHILFKQAADGSLIIGDSHEYADATKFDELGYTLKEHINNLMLTEAERIVNLDLRKLATVWAGYYPQHPKKHIVELDPSPNIHIRTCIGGKGMTAGIGYAEHSMNRLFNC